MKNLLKYRQQAFGEPGIQGQSTGQGAVDGKGPTDSERTPGGRAENDEKRSLSSFDGPKYRPDFFV